MIRAGALSMAFAVALGGPVAAAVLPEDATPKLKAGLPWIGA